VNLDEEEAAMVGAVGAGGAPAPAPLPRDEPLLNEGPLLDKARPLPGRSRGGCWSVGAARLVGALEAARCSIVSSAQA